MLIIIRTGRTVLALMLRAVVAGAFIPREKNSVPYRFFYIAIAAGTYWTQAAFDDEDELEDFEDAIPFLGDDDLDELL